MVVEFVAFDLETTGASHRYDGIYEIGLVHIRDNEVIATYESFIRTKREVQYHTRLNRGISQEVIDKAPTYKKVLTDVINFIGDKVLICHNKTFDERFLRHKMRTKLGVDLTNPVMCSLEMSREFLPTLPTFKLSAIATHFGILNAKPHQALSDAKVCADIVLCLMGDKPIATIIDDFEDEEVKPIIF